MGYAEQYLVPPVTTTAGSCFRQLLKYLQQTSSHSDRNEDKKLVKMKKAERRLGVTTTDSKFYGKRVPFQEPGTGILDSCQERVSNPSALDASQLMC